MSFVFSLWYIVLLLLAAGVAACLVVFFKMDKQDDVLIANFIKESTAEEPAKEEKSAEEVKTNE